MTAGVGFADGAEQDCWHGWHIDDVQWRHRCGTVNERARLRVWMCGGCGCWRVGVVVTLRKQYAGTRASLVHQLTNLLCIKLTSLKFSEGSGFKGLGFKP
eukprot:360252-Chlamydomonas_euryale.AAC.4